MREVLVCFGFTDGYSLGITTENASSRYSITPELQSTLEALGIRWPAVPNHILCMAHVIQLAFSVSMSTFGVIWPYQALGSP